MNKNLYIHQKIGLYGGKKMGENNCLKSPKFWDHWVQSLSFFMRKAGLPLGGFED